MANQPATGTELQQQGNTNFRYADNADGTKNVGSPVIDNFIKGLFGGTPPTNTNTYNRGGFGPVDDPGMLPTVQIGTTAPTPQLGAQLFPQQTDNDPGNMDMDYLGEGKVAANAGNTTDYAQNIALQNMLNNEGAALDVDGIRGPLTEAANNAYMARGQDDPDYSGLSAMDLTGDGEEFTGLPTADDNTVGGRGGAKPGFSMSDVFADMLKQSLGIGSGGEASQYAEQEGTAPTSLMPDGVPSLGFGGPLTKFGNPLMSAAAGAGKSIRPRVVPNVAENLTALGLGQAGIAGGQALTPTPEPQVGEENSMLMRMIDSLLNQENNRSIMGNK
jgi:hypothetical protein